MTVSKSYKQYSCLGDVCEEKKKDTVTHQVDIFGIHGDAEDGRLVSSERLLLAAVGHLHHLHHEVAGQSRGANVTAESSPGVNQQIVQSMKRRENNSCDICSGEARSVSRSIPRQTASMSPHAGPSPPPSACLRPINYDRKQTFVHNRD